MPNRLIDQTSPYLRQHADNPVDWHPWGEHALRLAREQNKPILLSIGYSACHWCHVMAHESFEDAATAQLMNDLFINIKVDREERPDLDKIYQLAHQALTGRGGGWPLTVFLAPDNQVPFYAGTYFPRQPKYGMPSFGHVLQQLRQAFDTRRDELAKQSIALRDFLVDYGKAAPLEGELDDTPIRRALANMPSRFDLRYGGYLGAPKFPHAGDLEFLLAQHGHHEYVQLSLTRMAMGGIHDQLGGGFCRYSVDERWEIPHFEKMLYDNALLLGLYARLAASQAPDRALYRRVCDDMHSWLHREMTDAGGGWFSALDADSEHEEGKFYLWTDKEVESLLTAEEYALARRHYGLDLPPNYEGHAWNLLLAEPAAALAEEFSLPLELVEQRLSSARQKLFDARAPRVRPGLDDKILTAWNALMIGGAMRAVVWLHDGNLQQAADRALDYLHENAWQEKRLRANSKTGAAYLPAYLDDYAFLLDALLDALKCRWENRDFEWAVALADHLLDHFQDKESGGFFFTADDHESLIQRPKPWLDEATPSGNGVAAHALLRLGHLSGDLRYLEAAERSLRAGWGMLNDAPQACATLLLALDEYLHPRPHLVVRCTMENAGPWRLASRVFSPAQADVYVIDHGGDLPGLFAHRPTRPGGVAYLCVGTHCDAPLLSPEDLRAALSEKLANS